MAVLLSRLGALAHRRRWGVVLVWLVALVGGAVGAATLSGETTNSFSIPGQESTVALQRIGEEFGAGGGATARVVIQAPDGQTLTTPENAAAVGELVTELGGLPGVASASNPLDPDGPTVNRDQTTAYSTANYTANPGGVTPEDQDALLKALDDGRASGLTVEATGEATQAAPHVGGPTEAIGVVIALVVLAITYGSLALAGMNLLTAVIGVGIGVLGVTVATGFVDLSSTTPTLAAMLGLAVGIDYALFIVNRYRQELRHGADVGTAIATAVGTAGSAVVTAGLTVVIALAGLFVVGIPFLTQMGIAAAATIVVAVLVALTLVPAVLSWMGLRALPRRQRAAAGRHEAATGRHGAGRRGFLTGWITKVTRHRVVSLLLAVGTLGVISIPVASMRTTLVQTPPEDSTQARAQQLLADGFGAGFNGPITILFDGAGAAEAAASARDGIAGLDDVALVTAPIPNADDSAALLTVIPQSGPTTPATEQLGADLRPQLAGAGGPQVSVTGQTAVSVDVAAALNDALPVYLALVVGLALVLLVLVFRSLLVPLVGVLGFLLTIGASLGATVAVFQWGWLADVVNLESSGPLISLTPILVIGILFGLAMDYQVFLVSRMHEAHSHGASPLDAIRTGFRQASPGGVAGAGVQ